MIILMYLLFQPTLEEVCFGIILLTTIDRRIL
jgi:hypothetical protein